MKETDSKSTKEGKLKSAPTSRKRPTPPFTIFGNKTEFMDTKEWSTPKVTKNTKISNQEHWDSLSAPRQGRDRTKEIACSEKDKRRRLFPISPKRKGSRSEGWEEDHDAGGEPEEERPCGKGRQEPHLLDRPGNQRAADHQGPAEGPILGDFPAPQPQREKTCRWGGREKLGTPTFQSRERSIQAYRLACLDRERQKSEDKRCPPKRRDLPAERELKLQFQTNVARSMDDPEETGMSLEPCWPTQSGPP